MIKKNKKKKLRLRKNTIFLGLIKKYRINDINPRYFEKINYKNSISFLIFKNYYILLMKIFYIFVHIKSWKVFLKNCSAYNLFHYYAKLSYNNAVTDLTIFKKFGFGVHNNIIVFSRPSKQLFLLFFKLKPIFIFTGGLMRIVMREKRKSSKKLYKVASSLIKLFSILLYKNDFFPQGYLKLVNVGILRHKILKSVIKIKKYSKIIFIIIKFRIDFTAQKFETRRAIKKYVKKRFKIR